MERYGRLDCLDNNVGRSAPGDVTEISVEQWRSMFALNVDSMMMMCKYAIPAMISSGGGGSIVNIGSLRSIRPQKSTVYTVTKGAVIALTATLAADHGAQGIRANCIILGPVFTPNINRNLTPERRQARSRGLSHEARRHRLGYGPARPLPALRPVEVHDRPEHLPRRRRLAGRAIALASDAQGRGKRCGSRRRLPAPRLHRTRAPIPGVEDSAGQPASVVAGQSRSADICQSAVRHFCAAPRSA